MVPSLGLNLIITAKIRGIIHEPSSPLNPLSNGLAELAAKPAKHLLSKSDNYNDFHKRLLSWRNVPSANEKLSSREVLW